ncbi:DNA polymerase III delta' subunit [Sphingobium sp. SYK-6]|uniref:DNA polymerase III subunit delta' n=1 Tax=Sphingobium sp. (strain NBRC 103272 / SYK-6) TaxID=627192 RepID=UPI00022775F0|nr:DNA polymerase III subunit delta' [Sphingobium sp. SYK-6]BAK66698.1 DNA polymerase III delta' subunit [Sphingobium sp. SYK-6]
MTRWFGHDAQIAQLIAASAAVRMHHGWILAGPKGVGKAGIAFDFAKRLLVAGAGGPVPAATLAPGDEDTQVRLLNGGAHPDFVRLERLERDDRKGDGSTLARNITVDQVRGLARLLHSAPSMGSRRVVLIDSADDLEAGAANALLKNLEEPPAGAMFLLVAHRPGRLLPTIRSRCRMLRFHALDDDVMQAALAQAMPDLPAAERARLVASGEGSPGQALAMRALDLPALEESLGVIAGGGRAADAERAKLMSALSGVAARPRLEAFVELVPRFIARRIRAAQGPALGRGLDAFEEAQRLGAGAVTPLQLEPGALVFTLCDTVAGLGEAGAAR